MTRLPFVLGVLALAASACDCGNDVPAVSGNPDAAAVEPQDASSPAADAGETSADAGELPDSGEALDASEPSDAAESLDSSVEAPDAAAQDSDAGVEERDAGTEPADAGPGLPDGGACTNTCGPHQALDENCQCVCANEQTCLARGDRVCVDLATEALCAEDADGCLYIDPTTATVCLGAATCVQGGAGCACPSPAACVLGANRCNQGGDGLETCVADLGGCAAYAPSAACAGTRTCRNGACECPSTSCVPVGGELCLDLQSWAACGDDGTGCGVQGAPTACAGQQTCSGGACVCPVPACAIGERRCNAAGDGIEACAADPQGCARWEPRAGCPTGEVCSTTGGTGQPACVCQDLCPLAGALQCAASSPGGFQRCEAGPNGCRAWTEQACASGMVCDGAKAQAGTNPPCSCASPAVCAMGSSRCDPAAPNVVQTCRADANGCAAWATLQTCSANQTCGAAGNSASCVCQDSCPSVGSLQCASAAGPAAYQACSADANGCRYWSDVSCVAPLVCDPAKAQARTSPPCSCPSPVACTLGEERCNGATPEVCRSDSIGCPAWSAKGAACSTASETCRVTGAAPATVASCACANPQCTVAGQRVCPVVGGTSAATCIADPQSTARCFSLSTTSCASALQTCVVGQGCVCTLQTCDPRTAPKSCSADGTRLSTCTADAGGCGTSADVLCADVYGPGSTCSTAGGPHCTCPPPTGDTLYVDGVRGSDGFGSGAASPPECALGSITKAASAASASRAFTKITVRPPDATKGAYNATAPNAEVFPIALPDGVTLATDDPAAPAGTYRIDNNGTAAVASLLRYAGAGTAAINGFTLSDSANLVTQALIECSGAGALTLESNDLDKSGAGGLDVSGGCDVTLTGTWKIRNSRTEGISVSAAASSVTLGGDGDIDGNAMGIGIFDGAVSTASGGLAAPRIQIRNSTSNPNVVMRPTSGTPPSFTCDGCTISGAIGTNSSGLMMMTGVSAPVAKLNGGFLQNNASSGADVVGGALTLTGGVSITGNAGYGLRLMGNATVTATDGPRSATITKNRGGVRLEQLTIGTMRATLGNIDVSENAEYGLFQGGGTVVLSGASRVNANGLGATAPFSGIHVERGTLSVDGTGASLTVDGNGLHGVEATAPRTGGTATVTLKALSLSTNLGSGLYVDQAAGALNADAVVVRANGAGGINVARAPAGVFSITDLAGPARIVENVGGGLLCMGNPANNAFAVCNVSGAEIASNVRGAGVMFGPGATDAQRMVHCDIHHNGGSSSSLAYGGLAFFANSNFVAGGFAGNKIHSNLNNQIEVFASNRMTTLRLSGPGTCLGLNADPNQIYCYKGGAGAYGIAVQPQMLPMPILVTAANNSWQGSAPVVGTDFTPGVSAGAACVPVTTCP